MDSKRHWSKFIPLESLAEYIEYQKKVTREGSAEQCKAGMWSVQDRSRNNISSVFFLKCAKVVHVWYRCLRWVCGLLFTTTLSFILNTSKDYWPTLVWKKECWDVMGSAILWLLWLERNRVVFCEHEAYCLDIIECIQLLWWRWLRFQKKGFVHSFYSWINNPLECMALEKENWFYG